jgi:phospholipase/carboxylesterase
MRALAVVMLVSAFFAHGCEQERKDPVSPASIAPNYVNNVAEPRVVSPGGKPPLLVLLHGIGADENDLFPVGPLLDPRLKVVSLRAPQPYVMGNAWFQIEFKPDGSVAPDVAGAKSALTGLAAWLAEAPAKFGTDPARTYVLGFSQGSMMSLGLLSTVPERLAGVIALSGRDPAGLFELTADPAGVARVPLFVAHGLYDDLLPVTNGRAIRERFQGTSKDFTYREYPVAHGVSEDEIAEIATWLRARLDRS